MVSNYYGQKATTQIHQKYEVLSNKRPPTVGRYTRGHTRASAMAHNFTHSENFFKMQPDDQSKLFKMAKFKNPKARTDTNNYSNRKSYFYKKAPIDEKGIQLDTVPVNQEEVQ